MSFLGGMGGGPTLGDGLIRIGAVTHGLRGAVRSAVNDARAELNAGASRIQGQSAAWGKAFGVIGAAAKIGLAGLTIGLLGAIGASVEFEKNWAGVRKTVDATPERLEKLRSEFRALAKEIPVSVNELAHIGETAGALGVATDSIVAFTKVTAELGSTTNVSSDQAATALGQLSNVLKLTEKDYEKFGSTLVDLGNKGASTESQILDIASRAGAAGKLIGLSTPDILAWGSAVASLGIETEAGGSALQFFFLQASKVVNEVTKTGIPTARQLAEAQMKVSLATAAVAKAQHKGVPSSRAIAEAQQRVSIAMQVLAKAQTKYGSASLQAQKASLSLAHAQDALAKAQKGSGGSAGSAQRAQLTLMKAQDALNKLTGKGSGALETMAKTAGMTAEAFKKLYGQDATKALAAFLTGLGKLPAGAQQAVLATLKLNNIRVIRALLGLANNAGELNRQLAVGEKAWEENTALAAAAGKRYETTSAQLSILMNVIKDLFISVGDNALPVVKWLVHAFREDIPKAAAFLAGVIQNIWTRALGPAVAGMFDALGKLGGAVASIFDFGSSKGGPSGIETVLDGIGAVAAQAAKFVGVLATAFAALLSNPIVNGLAKVGIILAGISLALSGGAAVVGKLSSGVGGLARKLTFGRLGGSGTTSGDPALNASAGKLTGSASALKEAAASLKKSAVTLPGGGKLNYTGVGGGYGGPTTAMGVTPGPLGTVNKVQGFQYGSGWGKNFKQANAAMEGAFLSAVPLSRKAEYLAHQREFDQMGKGFAQNMIANATGAVSSGFEKSKSALGKGLNFIGKLFWPAIIADLGIEFLKEPLGNFIASNTPFKRVGEQMKSDFFGGLISLVQSWSIGSDAFVGHNSTMTIGNMTFKTMTLAKLGVTSATFDKLEAPVGTIERAQGVSAAAATLAAQDFARAAGENANDWWKRIEAALPEETRLAAAKFFNQEGRGRGFVKDAAGLEALVKQATSQQLAERSAETKTAYVDALTDALKGQGFTAGQIGQLSSAQLATIGSLVQKDAEGKYAFVTEYLTNGFLGAIQSKTPGQVQLAASQKARVAALSKAFGADWQKTLASVDAGKAKPNKATVAKLTAALGTEWKSLLHDTFAGLDAHVSRGGGGDHPTAFSAMLANLKTLQDRVSTAISTFFKSTPTEVQQALDSVVSVVQGDTALTASIKTKLGKKFRSDWLVAFKDGTGQITDKPVDKSIVASMVKKFGPNWRIALQRFGELLFEREGGADAATLKATLAKALGSLVAGLTPADLTGAGQKPESKADAAKDRAVAQKFLTSQAGLDALAAAASDDTAKAKDGFKKLGDGLAKAIPDEATRNHFIGTLVALQKATQAITKPEVAAGLLALESTGQDAATSVTQASSALQKLAAAAQEFLSKTGISINGGGSKSGNKPKGPNVPYASGVVFDTAGATDITVGEAGREQVAVLRNFKTIRLPRMPVAATITADIVRGLAKAGMPSLTPVMQTATARAGVEVNADKLQLFSDGDRRSLDAQLAFLAPDGR